MARRGFEQGDGLKVTLLRGGGVRVRQLSDQAIEAAGAVVLDRLQRSLLV